jgi:hypothetical protein
MAKQIIIIRRQEETALTTWNLTENSHENF